MKRRNVTLKAAWLGFLMLWGADLAQAQTVDLAGPKRMHVVMLRDIDANALGRLFTRGMQDNAPREEFSPSIPGTLRMADIFSARKKLVAAPSNGQRIWAGNSVGTSVSNSAGIWSMRSTTAAAPAAATGSPWL